MIAPAGLPSATAICIPDGVSRLALDSSRASRDATRCVCIGLASAKASSTTLRMSCPAGPRSAMARTLAAASPESALCPFRHCLINAGLQSRARARGRTHLGPKIVLPAMASSSDPIGRRSGVAIDAAWKRSGLVRTDPQRLHTRRNYSSLGNGVGDSRTIFHNPLGLASAELLSLPAQGFPWPRLRIRKMNDFSKGLFERFRTEIDPDLVGLRDELARLSRIVVWRRWGCRTAPRCARHRSPLE